MHGHPGTMWRWRVLWVAVAGSGRMGFWRRPSNLHMHRVRPLLLCLFPSWVSTESGSACGIPLITNEALSRRGRDSIATTCLGLCMFGTGTTRCLSRLIPNLSTVDVDMFLTLWSSVEPLVHHWSMSWAESCPSSQH